MLKSFQGEWKRDGKTVEMNLPVMVFEDEGTHIAYIPVLDLSGYGNTEKEASDSLIIGINEYFNYTVRKNTLIEDLKAHGWTITKKSKPYVAPDITDLINKNEYLHDIVNTKPYIMKRLPVNVPQLA
ncbi:MAG: hypothetical protein ACR2KB_12925 [Chitinophagaceae bacterium]